MSKIGILTLLLLLVGVTYADLSVASFSVSPANIIPGGNGVITITLANPGPYKMQSVTINTLANYPLVSTQYLFIGDISVGGQVSTSIPFQVKNDAKTGIYSLRVEISGKYDTSILSSNDQFTTRNIDIPITVGSTPVFNLDYSIKTIGNKDAFELPVKLLNYGDKVKNAYVSISSSNFIAVGTYPKFLGEIENETSFKLDLALNSDTFSGKDTINVVLTYTDLLGTQRSVILPLSINVERNAEFSIGSVVSTPVMLVSGTDEASLRIELQNTGEAAANSINTRLNLPAGITPSYSYSDRYSLGTIGAGASKTAIYYVDVAKGTRGGLYTATIDINYKVGSEFKSISIPVEIRIAEIPEFEITSVSTEPANPSPGDKASLIVKIKNIGGKEADSVSFRAFSEQSQPFEYEDKTDFIGKLKPGEEGTAILTFTIKNNAQPKDYLISVEVRAVSDGNVIVSGDSVRFTVSGKRENSGFAGLLPYVTIIVVALVTGFFVGIYYERKRKK